MAKVRKWEGAQMAPAPFISLIRLGTGATELDLVKPGYCNLHVWSGFMNTKTALLICPPIHSVNGGLLLKVQTQNIVFVYC